MISVRRTGAWGEAARIALTMRAKFKNALEQAVMKEAHFIRGKIVHGIAAQAPGGQAFAPLSPITLAMRKAMGFGGTKALIRTGALRGAVTAIRVPGSAPRAFVGILRQAKGKVGGGSGGGGGGASKKPRASAPFQDKTGRWRDTSGRFLRKSEIAAVKRGKPGGGGSGGKGQPPLVNIAIIHEFGAAIPMTDKMRRFLWAKLKASGVKPSAGAGKSGGGSRTIVIPPRPFIAPVVAAYAKPNDVKRRFYANVANAMDGDLGRIAGARI